MYNGLQIGALIIVYFVTKEVTKVEKKRCRAEKNYKHER